MAASLGAVQNRLQYASNAISVTQENMSSSLSNIQDVNMATEMTTMTQQQVLQQAGTAMLAQANSQPQLVLNLITGGASPSSDRATPSTSPGQASHKALQ
jgi:flagellin